MSSVINHCNFKNQIEQNMDTDDFREAVDNRTEEIIRGMITGDTESEPHQFPAVELTAQFLATKAIEAGVRQILRDLNVDADQMIRHACSEHISNC